MPFAAGDHTLDVECDTRGRRWRFQPPARNGDGLDDRDAGRRVAQGPDRRGASRRTIGSESMTQLQSARMGVIAPEMVRVAVCEQVSPLGPLRSGLVCGLASECR